MVRDAASAASTALANEVAEYAVSVVIPTRNGERYLAQQLDSLLEQVGAPSFEVILSDNGSTDATRSIAEHYATWLDLKVIDSSAQPGGAFARNAGAAVAVAPLILFLDDDDVVAPSYIAAMVEALEHSELAASRIDLGVLNPGWRQRTRRIIQTERLPTEPTAFGYGATLGVRREAFERVGGFDTTLPAVGEDVDLCFRMTEAGSSIAFVRDAVLHYRLRDSRRALFQQGRRYARSDADLDERHPRLIPRNSAYAWLRATAGTARLLVAADRGDRWLGWHLLGRRVGALEFTVARYRRRWRALFARLRSATACFGRQSRAHR